MPLVLDATPGGADSNAYADVEEADEELAYRVGASAWTNEGDDEKIQDLVTAARELDTLPLRGEPTTPGQALHFPATGTDANGDDLPSDDIPYFWWLANIELALHYARQRLLTPTAQHAKKLDVLNSVANNRKRVKAGTTEVEFFEPGAEESDALSLSRFPSEVQRLIAPFVLLPEPASDWGSAVAVRAS